MMRIFRRAHGFESSGQIRYQVVGIFQDHVKADQDDSCTAASTKSIRSPCRQGISHAVAPMFSAMNSRRSFDHLMPYPPTSLLMTSPNNSQRSPLNFLS